MSADRRTIVIDIDTGEWLNGATISGDDGARIAASVLPGVPVEVLAGWYSAWMCDDPATSISEPALDRAQDVVDDAELRVGSYGIPTHRDPRKVARDVADICVADLVARRAQL